MSDVPRLKPNQFAIAADAVWVTALVVCTWAALADMFGDDMFSGILAALFLFMVLPTAVPVWVLVRCVPRAAALTKRTLRQELATAPLDVRAFLLRGMAWPLCASLAPALLAGIVLAVPLAVRSSEAMLGILLLGTTWCHFPALISTLGLVRYMTARCKTAREKSLWHVPVLWGAIAVGSYWTSAYAAAQVASSGSAVVAVGIVALGVDIGLLFAIWKQARSLVGIWAETDGD